MITSASIALDAVKLIEKTGKMYTKLIVFSPKSEHKYESLLEVYSNIVYAETHILKDLSILINECFIMIYHEQVKDMPSRPMFR